MPAGSAKFYLQQVLTITLFYQVQHEKDSSCLLIAKIMITIIIRKYYCTSHKFIRLVMIEMYKHSRLLVIQFNVDDHCKQVWYLL